MKRYILILAALVLCSNVIAQSDSLRQVMIARGGVLQSSIVTLEQRLSELRVSYGVADDASKASLAQQIMSAEGELFDAQRELKSIIAQHGAIVATSVVDGSSEGEVESDVEDSAIRLSKSKVVKQKLSESDLATLQQCDAGELRSYQIYNNFKDSYGRMRALRDQYNATNDFKKSQEYIVALDAERKCSDSLSDILLMQWSEVYDDKQFLYSLLSEIMEYREMLTTIDSLTVSVDVSLSQMGDDLAYESVATYELQKEAMLSVEAKIASRLGVDRCVDSLGSAAEKFASERMDSLSMVEIVERSFIDYSPINFAGENIYNSKNPIPRLKVYDYGTIYRVLLGTYSKPQSGALYMGAHPLMYRTIGSYYAYYGGGYATESEAQFASKALKQKGFRRADVVVWHDGVFRNLTMNPMPKSNVRVVLSGVESLPSGVTEQINMIRGSAELTRVGSDRYVISPLVRSEAFDTIIAKMKELAPDLQITITDLKE